MNRSAVTGAIETGVITDVMMSEADKRVIEIDTIITRIEVVGMMNVANQPEMPVVATTNIAVTTGIRCRVSEVAMSATATVNCAMTMETVVRRVSNGVTGNVWIIGGLTIGRGRNAAENRATTGASVTTSVAHGDTIPGRGAISMNLDWGASIILTIVAVTVMTVAATVILVMILLTVETGVNASGAIGMTGAVPILAAVTVGKKIEAI
jgi:hypothetical protein